MGWAERQLDTLRGTYAGRWDLWIVHRRTPMGVIWCAKPAGAAIALFTADEPEQLVARIGAAENPEAC